MPARARIWSAAACSRTVKLTRYGQQECLAERPGGTKPCAVRRVTSVDTGYGRRESTVVAQFMDVKEMAEYLYMSVQWVYREAPRVGLVPYRFGRGRNAKIQFRVSEVQAWVRQRRTAG
jgi:hypothetical protein